MNFLRLRDPLIGVLFEDDDIVAVDKPYGLDSHTNDSKKGNEAYVQPGVIELFEIQLGRKLHIIHRLDQTTTGVIVFGKSLESAKKYQQWFRARETKKTYVFLTAARSGAVSTFSCDQTILHKGSELEASTDFIRIDEAISGKFEKWEAHPHTGRNHQIRIHGACVGLPLLGDSKYGGADFPFLCLHNRRIEFPNGIVIESSEPIYFERPELLEDRELAKILHEIDRRRRLFSNSNSSQCLRLVHSSKDEARLLTLDQLGEILSVTWQKEFWSEKDERLVQKISQITKMPVLVRMTSLKLKDKSGKAQQVFVPTVSKVTPDSWHAREDATTYEIRTDIGQSLGLFPDQRLHRNWVKENSKDKTVLNLFSYTGTYSVAAALGGAIEVTSVDTSKAALNWARKNFEINSVEIERHRFFNRDALQFLEQCRTKNQTFDLIICDAPSFSRGEKGTFKLEVEIERLFDLLLATLATRGVLIFATHHEDLFVDDLRKKLLKTSEKLKPSMDEAFEINSIQSALDFELPGERVAMKSFLIRKLND